MRYWRDDPRRGINPLFNDNKLKLGLFALNGIGISMTTAPEAPHARWAESLAASRLADEAGFEANVPYARWRGWVEDNPSHKSSLVLEPFTWASATSQIAHQSAIFATQHVTTAHPIVVAKQCASIDQISGGRFGLNVVAGWNKPEFDMFGMTFNQHDDRYAQAAEWVDIITRLWAEDDPFDFEGEYYRISKGISFPKPVQRPRPVIMNAGGSERGRAFSAKYSDMAFVILNSEDPNEVSAQIQAYRDVARNDFNRDLQIWTNAYVVQRDNEAEARDFLNYYAVERGDDISLEGWVRLQGLHSKLMSPEQMEAMRFRFKAGSGGCELVGTPDQIVERLTMLSNAGIDGILLSWVGFEDGLQRWNRDVMPRLVQAGLRQ